MGFCSSSCGSLFDCLNRFPLDDINLVLKVFPGISPHLLVLEQMFWIPFFRDLWSTTGSVAATKVWQRIKSVKLPFIISICLLTYPCVCWKIFKKVLCLEGHGEYFVGESRWSSCSSGSWRSSWGSQLWQGRGGREAICVFLFVFLCFCLLVYSMCLFLSSL